MSESLRSDEQIINYLDGLMGDNERSAFETELARDSELKQRLDDLLVAREAVKQFGTRERVASLHKEMMEELKKDRSPAKVINIGRVVRVTLAVAASVLLVVVGIRTFNTSNNPEKLYNDAFVDYSLPITRGQLQSKSIIESDYAAGNYSGVTRDAQTSTLSGKDSFLTAISFLKTGATDSAIQWLHAVNKSSSFYPDAQFYLSLAYLKHKNYDSSLQLMNEIHNNPDHPYYSNISPELMEKVKKLK